MKHITCNKEYISNSFEDTQELAKKIAARLQGGEILALSGDLGAGKTAFVQGLAQALGISGKVTSPTFVFLKQYKVKMTSFAARRANKNSKRILYFCHFDLYRINSIDDAIGVGIIDYLGQKNAICAIEWAERIKKLLPKNTVWIKFEYIGKDKRKIEICNTLK